MTLSDVERRLRAAETAPAQSEAHHRKIAVARWRGEMARALIAADTHPLKRARLAAGYSQRTLSIVSGCSRDVISRAERDDPSVSAASYRRLANALGRRVDEIVRH